MKWFHVFSLLLMLVIALTSCIPASLSQVQVPIKLGIEVAAPTGTPPPTGERLYRSYPAPTGYPGFRKYYQKRCYPGCHSYPASTPESATVEETVQERPYRSYPAPTGYPGFRKYYQKRCYPGCHSYPTASVAGDTQAAPPTETPTVGRERPYRSYPAPTGYPGFRVYYQKRCYPGCHYDSSTAVPSQVHP